jgi:Tfp pilus assembly protein PilF
LKNIFLFSLFICLFVSCSANRFKSEVDFANKLAQQGLWQEAYFRWSKSLDSQKTSAAIYNNLAVYYDKTGKTNEAEDAYQKALKLEPENRYIQSNYKKFKQREEKKKNEN